MIQSKSSSIVQRRIFSISCGLCLIAILAILLALCIGSADISFPKTILSILRSDGLDNTMHAIVWRIRLPRALLAMISGGTLALGGLVLQALLRNPLAEPYILGISGGSAIGAILGIAAGLSRFPGTCLSAFAGSLSTLGLLIGITAGQSVVKKDSLLLCGVMVNAFCSAVIMFLISIIQDARLHHVLFWLMGDLSASDIGQVGILFLMIAPCTIVVFLLSHSMNLLLMGKEIAKTTGVDPNLVSLVLLVTMSFMVSAVVSLCGLIGFVGLVIPHLLRLGFGSDHRVLVPACVLGGGAFLVVCDTLARILARQGEMPVGIITAMTGAPLFIYLLKRSRDR